MPSIRLLDLNIWNYNAPWAERRALIADLINTTHPDVITLQEIRHESWREAQHQADQILDRLSEPYHMICQPVAHWSSEQGQERWEGLAVLSRTAIVNQSMTRLERDPNDERNPFSRLVLGAEIALPESTIWVFDTHYPLSLAARTRVAPQTLAHIHQTAGERPFVLTGDLNAEPDEWAIRFFTGQASVEGQSGDLVDAWTAVHPDQPGCTFPAWGAIKRIDYLFLSPKVGVSEIEIVGSSPNRSVLSPSDHCGLLAALQV